MLDTLTALGISRFRAALLIILGGALFYGVHFGYSWAAGEHEEIRKLRDSDELRDLRKERRQISFEIRQVKGNPMITSEVRETELNHLEDDLQQVQDEIEALNGGK